MNGRPELRVAELPTTWGPVRVAADALGVWGCELPAAGCGAEAPAFALPGRAEACGPRALRVALAYARAVLTGRDPGEAPALHPEIFERATPFRRAAWRALLRIPRGQTATYAELAAAAGRPGAARAAGGACGANPLPLFVPCHRVVAAGGVGGFSSGLAWKRLLLAAEGAWR